MTEYVLVVHVFRPIGRVVQPCYVDPMCFEDEYFLYSDISPLGISVTNVIARKCVEHLINKLLQ